MDYQGIIYTKEEGIATITLNRPERMNAFSPEMQDSIYKAIDDAAEDNNVRVLVLTGTGRAFCTGADVKAMADKASQSNSEEVAKGPEVQRIPLYVLLHQFEKPVIAAINGIAVGGGFDLALGCDIRIASDKATFAEIFIRRGLIPAAGGVYFLPRLVGMDKALQLIWTGDMIDAKEAERIGLVTMVVPHEELGNATRELAEKLAKGAPLAINKSKKALYVGLENSLQATLDYASGINKELMATEDHKEGARAFVEKRAPIFKGR